MADELVRIEISLSGGQIMGALVTPASADALDRALRAGSSGFVELEAEDGVLLVALPRVLYFKRFARETRVGFKA